MKNRFPSFLICLIFIMGCGPGEGKPAGTTSANDAPEPSSAPTPADTASLVTAIRVEFERINKATLSVKKYKWASGSYEECGQPYTEGTATYFYDNGTLVKIHNDGGEDHGEWKEDYYFKNGRLIFVYLDNAYGGAVNPTQYKYQNRYYFESGKLIQKLESTDPPFSLEPEQIDDMIKTASRLYTAKNSREISKILTCE